MENDVTLHLTNLTDLDLILVLFLDVADFNPGGPEIGASVDNAATEVASFSSLAEIFGPEPFAFTAHACSTATPVVVGGATFWSAIGSKRVCGVGSPDSNSPMAFVGLPPAASVDVTGRVRLSGTVAVSVPEPGALGLLAAGVLGLGVARARTRRSRMRRAGAGLNTFTISGLARCSRLRGSLALETYP